LKRLHELHTRRAEPLSAFNGSHEEAFYWALTAAAAGRACCASLLTLGAASALLTLAALGGASIKHRICFAAAAISAYK
jgi:hypothetical protein